MDREQLISRAATIRMAVFDVDGILTDGRLYYAADGTELKAFHSQDGLGLKLLQRAGVGLAVITGRRSSIVEHRCLELGIEHVYQGSADKAADLADLLGKTGLAPEQLCYAGDDVIDVPVMQQVGLSFTVPNAHAAAKAAADWVVSRQGGSGAVRDICDLLLEAQEAAP
ncbi:MAG: HAD hydrolase family protein [Xanthomonadales bacterium]|nr:HAD hydrolase family protein [Xanthomonadales bacterium]